MPLPKSVKQNQAFQQKMREDEQFRTVQLRKRKERNQRVRLEVIAHYGGRCTCCGENEPHFLELDHVNGGGRKHRAEKSGGQEMWRWARSHGYPEWLQLLCANCNHGKLRNGGVCPHEQRRSLREAS